MRKILLVLLLLLLGGVHDSTHLFATQTSSSSDTVQQAPSNIEDPNANNESEINKYRSGRMRPSPSLHQTPVRPAPAPTPTPTSPITGRTGGFLSHLGAFGAGTLLGSMFHPFGGGFYGGGYGYGYPSFSLFGFILDILLIIAVFSIIRRLFRRRY